MRKHTRKTINECRKELRAIYHRLCAVSIDNEAGLELDEVDELHVAIEDTSRALQHVNVILGRDRFT